VPTDYNKKTRSVSFARGDEEYLKEVAKKYGLAGTSAAIRFIINAFREKERADSLDQNK